VIRSIFLNHIIQKIGFCIVSQAALNTNILTGDGTTTASLISTYIVCQSVKLLSAGVNGLLLINGIELTTKNIFLNSQIINFDISSEIELFHICILSCGIEFKIANLVIKAMIKVGKFGTVTIQTIKNYLERINYNDGLCLLIKYYISVLLIVGEKFIFIYFECSIIVNKNNLENNFHVLRILEKAKNLKFSLILLSKIIENNCVSTLSLNKLRANIKVVFIKIHGFKKEKKDIFEDITIITGTIHIFVFQIFFVSDYTTILGFADKVIITKKSLTLIS